jgi:hypothetical protein
MEAASRPTLEPLSDLPVEEPPDAAKLRPESPANAGAPPVLQPPSAPESPPRDPEQTGLNFVDPELFLAAGQQPSAVPVATPPKDPEPAPALELEDPLVDEMLTSAPPPAAAAKGPTPAPARAAVASERKDPPAPVDPRSTRVPIARTASLAAAATKLAAASSRSMSAAPLKSAAPAASAARTEKSARPLPSSDRPAAGKTAQANGAAGSAARVASASPVHGAKPEAPSFASWASARSAAAPAAPAAPASTPAHPAATAAGAAPARSPAPKSAAASSAPVSAPAPAVPASVPMDRDFIARNQVVERYLSGRLPLKGAADFERFCHEHPEILDELGLPERVNAGLRLLEASGKPEPWQEPARPFWQKPAFALGAAGAALMLGMALAAVALGSAGKSHRLAELERKAAEQPLDPATSTREIRLLPSRSGASNAPAITIGGGGKTVLADLKIDESRSPYHMFRVTIDRIDQGRVGVIANLAKDSNGHLRIALNSSALGPGNYQLTLEGLDWHGAPQPDSWITIGVAR